MKATLTVLGSGTSMGVPTLGCDCSVCHSNDPHDRRTRPSIMTHLGHIANDSRGIRRKFHLEPEGLSTFTIHSIGSTKTASLSTAPLPGNCTITIADNTNTIPSV